MNKYNGYIKLYLGNNSDANSYVLCLLTSIKLNNSRNNNNREDTGQEFVYYKGITDWGIISKELKIWAYYYDSNLSSTFCAADLYIRKSVKDFGPKDDENIYIPPHRKLDKEGQNHRFTNRENNENHKNLYQPKNDQKQIKKFAQNKHLLFLSHPDETILLDNESLFSVTPETIAKHIADRMNYHKILDAFCGPGGNLIQFVLNGSKVLAVDNDPNKLCQARHNLNVYLNVKNVKNVITAQAATNLINLDTSDKSHLKGDEEVNINDAARAIRDKVTFLCEDFENVIEYFRQSAAGSSGPTFAGSSPFSKFRLQSENCNKFTPPSSNTSNRSSSGSDISWRRSTAAGINPFKYAQTVLSTTSGFSKGSRTTTPEIITHNSTDSSLQSSTTSSPRNTSNVSPNQDYSFLGSLAQLKFKGLDNIDAIFLDPPWGGLNYERKNAFDLDVLDFNLGAIYKKSCKITPNIVFKFPRNSNICQIASLLKPGRIVEIEQNYLDDWLKFLVLYFEDCVNIDMVERMQNDISINEK